jgi:hypothetical protein
MMRKERKFSVIKKTTEENKSLGRHTDKLDEIIKLIYKKYGVVLWTGFIWLSIACNENTVMGLRTS